MKALKTYLPLLLLASIVTPTLADKGSAQVIPCPSKDKLLQHGVEEIIFSTRSDSTDGHWYANIAYWSYDENKMLYGTGGRLCKYNTVSGKLEILIDDPLGTIRDPAVHYDAEKILFSWRKSGARVFHLYECDINGKNIRQLTAGKYDDIEPCYLPDGGIVFVSGRGKRYVNCWLTQVAIIYRCDGDGKNIRQLSANIEHDNTPWVLPDGRIIYQRWEYVDRSQVDYHHLWTMSPDGTGQTVYFGNMHPRGVFIDIRPIPGTDQVVCINSPGHGAREHRGQVATVTDRFGPDDRTAMKRITRGGGYCDPWALSADYFIAAEGKRIVGISGKGATEPILTLPRSYGGVNIQEPRPVIKRKRERIIAPRVDLTKATGRLILSDVYFGRNMKGVERGDIKKLLVLESLPKPINFTGGMDPLTYGGSFTLERIVGTIPVQPDGSAFMELPANRSFFFVALDKNNNSVKRMQSFLSVAPGEVTSCVGCHEQRGTTPANLDVAQLQALKSPPSVPEPIAGIPDVIDFPRDVQPILDRHCLKCHDYDKREGGVILTGDRGPMFSHSYATLTIKRQVADGRNLAKSNYPPRTLGTSASPLMNKIRGEHHEVKLSQREEDMIRYWIESAACYPGTYAALGHGSIGGYLQNRLVHRDDRWPTAARSAEAIRQRCIDCHNTQVRLPLPRSMSDEIGLCFWRFDPGDKRLQFSRHLMYNLTRPEKSMLLLAPLQKSEGGLGLCRAKKGDEQELAVFKSKDDPDYQAILAHITAGKNYLENELTRFDMPNFRPRREYFREMKRYGLLPETFDFEKDKDKIDAYELDRRYWKSLWYKPVAR